MEKSDVEQLVGVLDQFKAEDIIKACAEKGVFKELGRIKPKELSKDAKLLNIDFATIVKFDGEDAVYIPVAVDERGRKTVYELEVNKKTLMGIYVHKNAIYKDYMTRLDEKRYENCVETMDGKVVFLGEGALEVINEECGLGKICFVSKREEIPINKCRIWIIWSLIAIEW